MRSLILDAIALQSPSFIAAAMLSIKPLLFICQLFIASVTPVSPVSMSIAFISSMLARAFCTLFALVAVDAILEASFLEASAPPNNLLTKAAR